MEGIVEIKKSDLFKTAKIGAGYELIKNNYSQVAYKLFIDDWDGYKYTDSLRVPFRNEHGRSLIQEHKEIAPVYKQSDYEEWLKDESYDLQEIGYCEAYLEQAIHLLKECR